ncbi:helix-turn-helix transcriptional regulator [Terribacillus halophilus]|uniref:helix-turn-helix transcriptional regulator n=1 Tax=Terribacillus halophilus TaxID=361279 RepID=UPI000984F4EC|nr:AraC family transcriptional regulator [Terribacillus halophilus]
MLNSSFLSMLTPPLPYFLEGNLTTFRKGQRHPARKQLGFFDVLVVKEGRLFIGEETERWQVGAGEALILEPAKFHYPTAACEEDTAFYWLHMQTPAIWREQEACEPIQTDQNISFLHYHTSNTTVHLPKHQRISHPEELYQTIQHLLQSTIQARSFAFWETQQLFLQVLQHLSYSPTPQHASLQLAERVEMYIKQHYMEHITNTTLASHFHVHENYLARCMKQAYHCTPLTYLAAYRLHQARLLLLKTDWPLQKIAEEVEFSRQGYFSTCFKQAYGMAPSDYRKNMLQK